MSPEKSPRLKRIGSRLVDAILSFTSEGMGELSPFSQDMSRAVDLRSAA